jgi:hypothetical protein
VAYPSSTTPLREAVVHALTRSTGLPRALPDDQLLVLWKPGEVIAAPSAGQVYRTAKCMVLPILSRPIEPQLEMTDRMPVEATIEIRCWYFTGKPNTSEWTRAMREIETHSVRVPSALTYPGNLATAPDGTETGLWGGSLRVDGDRYDMRGAPVPREPSIFQVTHLFRRIPVELARPSTT